MKRFVPVLLLATLLFAACDSDDSGDPGELPSVDVGEFVARVEVEGGETLDLSGLATASTSPFFVFDSLFVPGDSLATPDSAAMFTISLINSVPRQGPSAQPFRSISFQRFGGERPTAGPYPLGSFDRFDFSASFISFSRFGGGSFLSAESGTLTIDRSTEEGTAGSFTFRGSYTPLDGTNERTAIVTGRFDARAFEFDGTPYPPLP